MASELSVWLARFIDIYEKTPDQGMSLKSFLEQPYVWSDDDDPSAETVGSDARRGAKRTRQFIDRRIPGGAAVEAEFLDLLNEFDPSRSISAAEVHEFFGQRRKAIEDGAAESGKSMEDFALNLESQAIERQRSELRSPNLHIHFLKQFAIQLDKVASRTQNLEELAYRDILVPEVRSLLHEAHYCYLFGFEAASAVMCGAVIEQLLRRAFAIPDKEDLKLESALYEARVSEKISQTIYEMAEDVRNLRNMAAHHPKTFDQQSPARKSTILSNTRAVAKAILENSIPFTQSAS